jgi:hypothetical protein
MRYLRSRAMAAFNIYFKRRLEGMPPDHVNLINSHYGISFIDVSQSWPGLDVTVLNLIASDFTDLEILSPRLAVAALMKDLLRYLPSFGPEDVNCITFQPHLAEPLFMNNVGGWTFRPIAKTQIRNLYLAGDFTRSHIDLVSMEGAISTGLAAAEAVRKDLSLTPAVESLAGASNLSEMVAGVSTVRTFACRGASEGPDPARRPRRQRKHRGLSLCPRVRRAVADHSRQ